MFNLKTILRSTPKDRREFRTQTIEYKRQQRVQAQNEIDFKKNQEFANAQQIAEYNRLRSDYDKAFIKQGKILADSYQSETYKALTKQAGDLANYYKKQEVMNKLEVESQESRAIADKLNILGTSILDDIKTNKARKELAMAQARSSSSRRSSRARWATSIQNSYSISSPLTRTLQSKAKVSRPTPTHPIFQGRSILDRILGR